MLHFDDIPASEHRSYNYYRASADFNVPFALRSVGHCRAKRGWHDYPEKKNFIQIFWSVSGRGLFELNGTTFELPPHHSFVYYQGERHLVSAKSPQWEYYFFTIDGPLATSIITTLRKDQRIINAAPCPSHFFESLAKEIDTPSLYEQCLLGSKAYELATLASTVVTHVENSIQLERCVEAIKKNYCNSRLNISLLSEMLDIHRTHITRLFKRELGISPIEFLVAERLKQGLQLLDNGELSIADIAQQCGYSDPNYFSKSVKKFCGTSPRNLRKAIGGISGVSQV